jgi:DNA repair protein RecO (recombination protein O)
MIVTTDAVVLHSRRYGDTSRIAVLYSRDLGKVTVMAKGARTPKSPFGSSLEPLSRVKATIYHRRNRDMHTISAAEHTGGHLRLHDSYDHLSAALAFCQLIHRTQADEVPMADVFDLLTSTLHEIDTAEPPTCFSRMFAAQLRLAEIMGFGLPIMEPPPFTALKLSMTDGLPRPESAEGFRMSTAAYNHLQSMLTTPLDLITLVLTPEDRLEVEAFLQLYFAHHLR